MFSEDSDEMMPSAQDELTEKIQEFWTRHVNAERIMGKAVTAHERGSDEYYLDLETQRYRSHRHLLPWILSMTPGKSVLEIGCGVGLDTFTMAKHGLEVTAVDLTQVGIQAVSERFKRHGLGGQFRVADACRLPFEPDSFDYVYSFGVLHHVADTEKSIREVHRVLKPGGVAKIMLYNRHSLNEIVHQLTRVPFEEKNELCPVVRRFTRTEVERLFHPFSRCEKHLDYIFGEGYGKLFKIMPLWLYAPLSRYWGWHLMISATK